jgi:peptidoglycan/xylan/chitin deacetylase (PgdA/CDA1 family)
VGGDAVEIPHTAPAPNHFSSSNLFQFYQLMAQFSLDYPRTFGGVVPPVNNQLVGRFGSLAAQTTEATPIRSSIVMDCLQPNDWAITFDDGPSVNTPRLLQDLRRRNIKATFFVVGVMVRDNPDILRQIVSDGHQIAIHTWSHPNLDTLTNQQIITEIMYTYQIIRDVTGLSCRIVRAPFGQAGRRVHALLNAMGFEIVHWNLDTKDAQSMGQAVRPNVDRWISSRASNVITLQHDLHPESVQAAPYLLDQVQQANYRTVTVGQCTGLTVYGQLQPNQPQPNPPISSSTTAPTSTTTTSTSATVTSSTTTAVQTTRGASGATSTSYFSLLSILLLL